MINIETAYEVENYLKNNKFFIFGTGFVAENLYRYLENNKINNNVMGYVETNPQKSEFNDLPVYTLEKISKLRTTPIIIAVHYSIFNQIKAKLDKLGITDWIWIYPFLCELICGHPYKKNVIINPYSFIHSACFSERVISSIYLIGIGYMFNQNKIGKNICLKYLSLFSTYNTALKRWDSFSNMISKFDGSNISNLGNLMIASDLGLLIDGNHRLSLALYKKIPEINADLFNVNYEMINGIFQFLKLLDSKEGVRRLFDSKESKYILRLTDKLIISNDINQYCVF